MAVLFHCPKCNQKLTLTTSKPSDWLDCPNCEAVIQVPGSPSPSQQPVSSPPRSSAATSGASTSRTAGASDDFTPKSCRPRKTLPTPTTGIDRSYKWVQLGALTGGVLLLVLTLLVLIIAAQKPNNVPEQAQNEPALAHDPVPPGPEPALSTSNPPIPVPMQPKIDPLLKPIPPKDELATPPKPAPPAVVDYTKLDQFGNPIGHDVGLAHQNEFKGQRLLFWSPHTAGGDIFFGANNPLWKGLEEKGFVVRREFGKFKVAWLEEIDQLWILSTAAENVLQQGRDAIMQTPEQFLAQLRALKPEEIDVLIAVSPRGKLPPGWSRQDFIDARVADIGMSLSPSFRLTEGDYDAIVDFVKAGKGLCLLADNDPFTEEANELGNRLFEVTVKGNYQADKIAYLKNPKLTPEQIRKFRGEYEVAPHSLLEGVNFVYEGITVSNISLSSKLEVALRASDGKPVVVVSKEPGQRVVIDCGFTRYCHGTNERTSYILRTAGTIRLGQNIAAFLAGKGSVKKP